MSTTINPVDRLRRICSHASAGLVLDASDAEWLVEALQLYLERASHGFPIARALGLAVAPGGTPWWRREALARRDAALRRVAREHYGSLRQSDAAGAIAVGLSRYASSSWRHDRDHDRCPDRYQGQREEHFFAALKAIEDVIDKRQVLRIIAKPSDTKPDF